MAKSQMLVRYATESDLPDVYRLSWAGYKELKEILPEKVDPDLLWNWVIKAYRQAPQVLLEKDGEIIGFWGLCLIKAEWSHDVILADYMFYVLPEHRTIKATKQLVKAVCDVADKHKLTFRQCYLFKGKMPVHARIFGMMGFTVRGLVGFYKGN